MTAQEYLEKLKILRYYATQEIVSEIIVPNANELLANIKNRIVRDKKNSSGGSIGQYSTKPMYATPDQFDKRGSFKAQGKRESTNYATVNISTKKATLPKRQTVTTFGKKVPARNIKGFNFEERRSMYLPGGYKELRNIQGKPIDAVNFNYTGSTMLSYQMQVKDKEVLLGLTNAESAKIREGLEDGTKKRRGYGKVFQASQQELAIYNKNVIEDSKELTLRVLHA